MQGSDPSAAQWFLTTQGASIYGIEPEGNESKTWAFTPVLRDLVYAFPSGANQQEWREWIEEIYRAWMVCQLSNIV